MDYYNYSLCPITKEFYDESLKEGKEFPVRYIAGYECEDSRYFSEAVDCVAEVTKSGYIRIRDEYINKDKKKEYPAEFFMRLKTKSSQHELNCQFNDKMASDILDTYAKFTKNPKDFVFMAKYTGEDAYIETDCNEWLVLTYGDIVNVYVERNDQDGTCYAVIDSRVNPKTPVTNQCKIFTTHLTGKPCKGIIRVSCNYINVSKDIDFLSFGEKMELGLEVKCINYKSAIKNWDETKKDIVEIFEMNGVLEMDGALKEDKKIASTSYDKPSSNDKNYCISDKEVYKALETLRNKCRELKQCCSKCPMRVYDDKQTKCYFAKDNKPIVPGNWQIRKPESYQAF